MKLERGTLVKAPVLDPEKGEPLYHYGRVVMHEFQNYYLVDWCYDVPGYHLDNKWRIQRQRLSEISIASEQELFANMLKYGIEKAE